LTAKNKKFILSQYFELQIVLTLRFSLLGAMAHACNHSYMQVEIRRITFEASSNVGDAILTNKPGAMVYLCYSKYAGSLSRRIMV
jgi:hypothetical protein